MFALTPEPSHDPETTQWQAIAPAVLIYAVGKWVLIFATAVGQQNWARWLYSALVVLDVAIVVIALVPPGDSVFAPSDIFLALFLLADIATVYFAFSLESDAWFDHPRPGSPLDRV